MFASTINIAVASNVSYAIKSLTKEFNKLYPDTKVQVTLGSSGKLTSQINHSAPYDIFMSANMKYPNFLYAKNLTISKPIIYTKGSLALLSSKKQDFSKGLTILEDKKIKIIAIANPKTAPYGIATAIALKNAKLYNKLKSKFIYGESISQTVSYTMTAANIGFVAKSSLYSIHMKKYKKEINWIDIPSSLYTPINQGIAILKNTKNIEDSKKFYNFILSNKGQNILEKFGYTKI
jgi:molybdate transport system substrate-binding protein